jgi:hypothetical protein
MKNKQSLRYSLTYTVTCKHTTCRHANIEKFKISSFHRRVDKIFELLGCSVGYFGSCLPTFRDTIGSFQVSRSPRIYKAGILTSSSYPCLTIIFLNCLTFENGTEMVSRNVGTKTTHIFSVITQKNEEANDLKLLILE